MNIEFLWRTNTMRRAWWPARNGVLLVALISALLMSASVNVAADTYYVAITGNDAAVGTQAQPWRSIQHAATKVSPGDTVVVATGVYEEKVAFTRSGEPGKKIVFRSGNGQAPIIDGRGVAAMGPWDALVAFNNVSYVHLEGFVIRNSAAYNVWIGGESHHLQLLRLDIHHGGSSGIWVDGPKNRPAMSVFSGNKVHDHLLGGITLWAATGGYYRIDGNEVWGNLGIGNYDGIQIGGGNAASHHVVVKNNVVHDNGSTNIGEDPIDLGGHALNHHYLVEGNSMYAGTGSFKLHSGDLKSGWYVAGTSSYHIARFNRLIGKAYVAYHFPNPIAVYNNTFVNCGQCVMFYENSFPNQSLGDSTYAGGDAGRMVWKNNLFFQEAPSTEYALLQAGGAGATIDLSYRSVRFMNNMYKFAPGQRLSWNVVFGPGIDEARFLAYKSSNASDSPDLGSFLSTVSLSQMFTEDYHLALGSPAIDKGAPLTKAVNTGINSTKLIVDRASVFQDGYCIDGECLNTPDSLVIDGGLPIAITSVNDVTNTITLAASASWRAGASVTLPYAGAAPDIGAFEHLR